MTRKEIIAGLVDEGYAEDEAAVEERLVDEGYEGEDLELLWELAGT